MTQHEAIQELAILIQELCLHLSGVWQPEETPARQGELAQIARKAHDIEMTVNTEP